MGWHCVYLSEFSVNFYDLSVSEVLYIPLLIARILAEFCSAIGSRWKSADVSLEHGAALYISQ